MKRIKSIALEFSLRNPMNKEVEPKDRSGVVSIFDILFGGDVKNYQRVKEKTLENREKEKKNGKN